ncbi:hypothetical protein DC522_17390 [Microvirga sp. KLBC 81]|uniref:hypothetical protein n=1 Tax=Microvirga sp. KLBC 81 TaxID=1862707 RepID=UPI000D524F5F|nr:hypothetical protein [Microvirga sp. KLBC 81]PVE23131.1 hypothetical protein DC522_17390 [Microvirga sp. KLBC 81]
MIFRRKPKPPLRHAEELVREAVAIVYESWRDKDYRPSPADLRTFRELEEMLFRSYATMRRITIRMERRFYGEAEVNERKWLR